MEPERFPHPPPECREHDVGPLGLVPVIAGRRDQAACVNGAQAGGGRRTPVRKRVGRFVGSRCRTGPAWRWPRGSDPGAPWAAKKLRDAVVTKPRLWQRDGDGGPPRPTPARGRVGHRACWTARAPVRGARLPLPFPGHGWLFACASPASALFPRPGAGPREPRALGSRPWDPRGRWRTRPGAGRRFSSGQHGLAQACALPLAMLVLGRNLRGRFLDLDQNGAEEKMDNGPGHQLCRPPRVSARGHRPSPVLARPAPSLRPVVATRTQCPQPGLPAAAATASADLAGA